MKCEYKAIVDAGFILQLDCPDLAMLRHTVYLDRSLSDFRDIIAVNVAALNHAVADLPADRMRMHVCWGSTLDAIAAELDASASPRTQRTPDVAALEAKYSPSGKRPSDALILAVLRHLDLATHVVTEGSSEDAIVQDMAVRLGFRNVHFSPRGEGLGWAMPLGVGIGLATRKPAVCFVGDGGSLFSIHALWTAAKYRIPSIFICFVNHEYRLLKDLWCNAMGTTIETTHFVGMDFDNPNLDMQGIAAGFGARIEKIDKLGTIGEVLGRALSHAGPSFLIVDREP